MFPHYNVIQNIEDRYAGGLTQKAREEIKKKWKYEGIVASDAGTKMHYNIECFYNLIPS